MKNMKRFLTALIGAVALLAVASVAVPGAARATCQQWDILTHTWCTLATPNPPAGATTCASGSVPDANHMNFYSGSGGTGYCISLLRSPTGAAGSNEPNAITDGWYNPFPIAWVRVGSGTTGYIYQGTAPNFGAGWQVNPGFDGDVSSLGIHTLMAR